MSSPEYPDRAQWPAYWRGMRRAAVWVVVSSGAALVLLEVTNRVRILGDPWRLVLLLIVALVVGAAAERLVDWLARRWDDRLGAAD